MKRALITIMLAALMAGIPVFAGARKLEGRTGANTIAISFPEPAIPQYRRRYYRRRYRRRHYVVRRRYYPRHYRRIYYRRRRY